MSAPDVTALLAELERSEPDLAEDARTAVEWLTGGEPLETVTQLDVCEFLWYTLPLKVGGDHERLARSLGRLLLIGGMERYAALCVSPTTTQILRAYAREGEDAGTAAYQEALESTGVLPPDVPDLRWSMIMGPEELGAHVACSAALELAIIAGAAVDRVALTRRWLTEPRAELGSDELDQPRARRTPQPLGARPRPGQAGAGPAVRGAVARAGARAAAARAAPAAQPGRDRGEEPAAAPVALA
ncbi:hypothetical protein OIE66_01330 [Nonomuraea sp. NBC_01738]|uniref:hypothetical protein n=1 Tax=Nonomuraea sp. NBC_01738 TaxID=2976003 RepID=UPI002E13A03E|nr:hypothetical protein OIE66_01330 [Nonomuraea sp. NBC_01738]